MTTAKRWSYTTGERGRNRVRVFEDGKRPLLAEFYEDGRRRRISLGHRDHDRAKREADQMAAEFAHGHGAPQDVTLASLFDNYVREVTPTKSAGKQHHDRSCAEMFKRLFGRDRKARTLNRRDWDRFVRARRSGSVQPGTDRPGPGVRARQVEYDLRFLMAVLNWGTQAANHRGEPLLTRNPLKGLAFPKEESPQRPMLTHEQYKALLGVASQVDWRFGLALVLAHETGHRIGAVRLLRWSDVDLDKGRFQWRAETDKIGYAHVTPMTEDARAALVSARYHQPGIGDAWVFPSPQALDTPCSRHILRDWWKRAWSYAELVKVKGLGWHSLRRKFASEMKHAPLRDLCELGGWKDPQTVLKCYQRPDEATMREALRQRKAL